MKIYVGQTNLKLSLITNIDLTDAQTAVIKYLRPNGIEGNWSATVTGQLVEHNFVDGDLDASGDWVVWAYITMTTGKISIGEPSTLTVNAQGT